MPDTTTNLKLKRVRSGAGAETLANDTFEELDALVGGAVNTRTLSAPVVAVEGARYIVKPTGSGAWLSQSNRIAHFAGGEWRFYIPPIGLSIWISDEKVLARWDGTSWKTLVGDAMISLYRTTSNETIVNSGTGWGALNWNGEFQKDAGVFAHDNTTNPDQIVLLEAGSYMAWWNVTGSASSAASNVLDTRLTQNGSAILHTNASGAVHSTSNPKTTVAGMGIIIAAPNDVLRLEAQRSSGSSTLSSVADYTRLVVRRVGG